MIPSDIETLRKIFADKRIWCVEGVVTKIEFAQDMSVCRVKAKIFPDDHEIVARMSWDAVGPEAGTYGPISVRDLVLIAYSEGSEDGAYVIRRMSSKEDKIPEQVKENHTVVKSLPGKRAIVWGQDKANIVSPNRINLATDDVDVTEPLVLGEVNKEFMEKWFSYFLDSDHIGVCAVGPVYLAPEIRAQMILDKQKYLEDPDTNILSQLSFTERGGA